MSNRPKHASFKVGDHLVSPRTGYSHHGLYIGNEEVIHYSGFANGISNGEISIASLEEFANGHRVSVKPHANRKYDGDKSVERAFERLGEDWYNVLVNNCEHFVTWCIEGFHSSSQVNGAIIAIAAAYIHLKDNAEKYRQWQAFQGATGYISKGVVSGEVTRQVSQAIAPRVAQSVINPSAGTVAGIVAGAGTASITGATTAIASGILATSAAPILVTLVVGYGAKKVFDWFWD